MLEQSFHTPLPLELEVSLPSGQVDVETAEGEESTVEVDGDERLLEQVEIRHDGSRLVVELRRKRSFSFFGNGGLRVRARVPHGAAVKVKTASADLEVVGRIGRLDAGSASGDVRVRGSVEGNATVKSVSGDAELERVDGDLSVQSVSGDVRVGLVGGSIDTKSVSGDIRLAAVGSGSVRFASVSGDVEVGIAEGSLLDVDAGSTSGDLGSDVPLGSEPPDGASAGAPTVVLRGRTVSGDVHVFRAG